MQVNKIRILDFGNSWGFSVADSIRFRSHNLGESQDYQAGLNIAMPSHYQHCQMVIFKQSSGNHSWASSGKVLFYFFNTHVKRDELAGFMIRKEKNLKDVAF